MTYTFKLSRRLARFRGRFTPAACDLAHASNRFSVSVLLATLLVALGCSAGEPTGISTTVADEVIDGPVAVSPRIMTLEGKQGVMYQAFESMLPGSGVVTSVEWTATGGTIAPNGAYSSSSTGAFKVIGRRKGNPKNPPDTSTVTVVPPQPTLAAVVVSPSSANLIAGQTQQFTASGKLSDGSSVAIGVTWTTTGGTIDVGGLYAAPNTAGTFQVVATHVTTGIADTVNVSVRSVQSVKLTPGSASLSASASQQFATSATLSDGSTVALSNVFYSATGGTISAGGLYKAPSTAGSYSATAKLAAAGGPSVSATAPVTVTGGTTWSSGSHPNEPAGFTRVMENSLAASTLVGSTMAGSWGGPWYGTGNFVPLVSDPTNPLGHSYVSKVVWPSGLAAGQSPTEFGGWNQSSSSSFAGNGRYRKLYVSIWVKIPTPDYQNQNTGTKLWYTAHGNMTQQNADFLLMEGTYNGTSIQSAMRLKMYISPADEAVTPGSLGYVQNVNQAALVTCGTWHQIEVYMDQGTIDHADGTLRIWVDRAKVTDYTGSVKFLDSAYNFTQGFYYYQFTPVWGGTGGTRTRTDAMLINSIYISGTN
jgi:hypothetical protein